MKKQILIVLSVVTGLLSACSTANFAYYDDIYSSSGEKVAQTAKSVPTQTTAAKPAVEADSIIYETDENGNLLRTLTYYPGSTEPVVTTYMEVVDDSTSAPVATSGNYDPDDYYDYAYASRIRRFHTNVYVGWGYYDPFFTNMYWYDYQPASWGISIYMGYNWWWPGYYRPYYYSPCWYDYGWRYGWGWCGPHYACHGPWHHHHHGYAPIDYYHNHHDHNNSYYYGHRNNIGPSVGNPNNGNDRGERPDAIAGAHGYGNGETNNHYSVTSSPVAFNQRYDNLVAGTTGAGSSFNNISNNSATSTTPTTAGKMVTGARADVNNNIRPTTNISAQPANTGSSTVRPATSDSKTVSPSTSTARTNVPVTNGTTTITRPASTNTVTTSRTNTNTISRPATNNTTGTRPSRTVTRTVVTPSSTTARPANASGNSRTVTRTVPSTSRPATSSSSRNYNTPSSSRSNYNTPSSRRSNYSSPSSSSRSNYSSPSRSSRSNYSSPSSSSRSNYSSPSSSRSSYSSSSSSRSSYSSGSSYSGSSSRGGGSYSGGSHSSGGGSHSGGRR